MSNEKMEYSIRSLVVIAHPDDETLYFFSGLKELSEATCTDLLCLTYDENSLRAEELKNACKNLAVKIYFGGIKDSGIAICLQGVEKTLNEFINQQTKTSNYEMAITHPFHGGEKPHPHHIQTFHALRDICFEKKITFGFFSEKTLRIPRFDKSHVVFDKSFELKLFINRIGNVLKNWVSITFLLSQFKSALASWKRRTRSQKFSVQTYTSNLEEKKDALSAYKSQAEFLKNYKTSMQGVEFLYLEK